MFETPNNVFILELLRENNRAKNCRKASYRKKIKQGISPVCIEQNTLRKMLKEILPADMKPVEDNVYGVDYIYGGVKIDQKFSFGSLGNNTIKIRVRNRRLLNNSDWTMIINREWKLEFFQTKKLEAFVRKNWGVVQKKLVEKKEAHTEYAINLKELYLLESIEPIRAELTHNALYDSLEEIFTSHNGERIYCPIARKPRSVENERIPRLGPISPGNELMPNTK